MSGTDLEKMSEFALKAVTQGATLLTNFPLESLVASTKENHRDLVTEVDKSVEQLIQSLLKDSRLPVVSEESFETAQGALLDKEPVWVVDPIDGTTNFIHQIPFYGVSVGMWFDGPAIGAVAVPSANELYFTHGSHQAYLNGSILRIHDRPAKQSLVAVTIGSTVGDEATRFKIFKSFEAINHSTRGCLRLGSAAINVCYVACGRLQAAYGVGNKIWDISGALAVARLAGAKFYLQRKPGSAELNYIVGTPTAADHIREVLEKEGLNFF